MWFSFGLCQSGEGEGWNKVKPFIMHLSGDDFRLQRKKKPSSTCCIYVTSTSPPETQFFFNQTSWLLCSLVILCLYLPIQRLCLVFFSSASTIFSIFSFYLTGSRHLHKCASIYASMMLGFICKPERKKEIIPSVLYDRMTCCLNGCHLPSVCVCWCAFCMLFVMWWTKIRCEDCVCGDGRYCTSGVSDVEWGNNCRMVALGKTIARLYQRWNIVYGKLVFILVHFCITW